jgi:hypothetical protein
MGGGLIGEFSNRCTSKRGQKTEAVENIGISRIFVIEMP